MSQSYDPHGLLDQESRHKSAAFQAIQRDMQAQVFAYEFHWQFLYNLRNDCAGHQLEGYLKSAEMDAWLRARQDQGKRAGITSWGQGWTE